MLRWRVGFFVTPFLALDHEECMSLIIFSWVWPTTFCDCRSHIICGLGCGFALNGILFAEVSVSICIHEGTEDSGFVDGGEVLEVGIVDLGFLGELKPTTPAAIVLGLGCHVNSLFLG